MAIERRLTFYAWTDTSENHPFDRLAAATEVGGLGTADVVYDNGRDELTAVDIISIGTEDVPTKLLLHALHGPGNRPSEYGPGEGTRTIQIGDGRYTGFTAHVMVWKDKVAALDTHSNSPGLGRLAIYFRKQAKQRVAFRPLYNQRAAEKLNDLDGIRGVDLAIHDSHKVIQARNQGMLESLIPPRDFPSISVSAGMSRKQPKDSYIDPAVEEELLELADSAEQYFDRLIVRGLSKSQRTKTGKKKSVSVNLLSERLHIAESLASDEENPSLPRQDVAFSRLAAARQKLNQTGELEDAAEARLSLETD
jgi:hypothetical protein